MDRNGTKWSREETILAFELYCRTAFSKISSKNPEVIALAQLIGRTPGSVALKMHNLAHYDPKLQDRNVTAMSHTSKLDKEIFFEFSEKWLDLSYQAQVIRASIQNLELPKIIDIGDIESIPPGEYREAVTKARIGQYFFRTAILNSYGNKCCITGVEQTALLNASHIKPWSVCDEQTERTNPRNGLCLNALHDRAFDRGLITIDNKYRIIVSEKIRKTHMDEDTKAWFLGYENKQISLPDKFLPSKEFIEYHNDMVFLG